MLLAGTQQGEVKVCLLFFFDSHDCVESLFLPIFHRPLESFFLSFYLFTFFVSLFIFLVYILFVGVGHSYASL